MAYGGIESRVVQDFDRKWKWCVALASGRRLGEARVTPATQRSYSFSSRSGTSHNKNAIMISAGVQASMAPNAMACTVVMIAALGLAWLIRRWRMLM